MYTLRGWKLGVEAGWPKEALLVAQTGSWHDIAEMVYSVKPCDAYHSASPMGISLEFGISPGAEIEL
jgi:hypothetical protein